MCCCLQATHKDNTPSEIVYSVKDAPSHGFLRRSAGEDTPYQGTKGRPIQSFSQQDIDDGLIQYVHVGSEHATDTFLLDVSNGLTEVIHITVTMDVIPQHIPVQVSSVTLKEGSSRILNKDVIQVTNHHFSGLNFLYQMTVAPHYGQIENLRIPGVAIPSFTRLQVISFTSFPFRFTLSRHVTRPDATRPIVGRVVRLFETMWDMLPTLRNNRTLIQ